MTEEERREMTRSNYAAQMEMLGYDSGGNPLDNIVRVVRSKDCKYWEADWKPNNVQDGVHFCPMVSLVRRGDWFCANGERRDA